MHVRHVGHIRHVRCCLLHVGRGNCCSSRSNCRHVSCNVPAWRQRPFRLLGLTEEEQQVQFVHASLCFRPGCIGFLSQVALALYSPAELLNAEA